MAVLASKMMMWFRRCCDALGNPGAAPCTNTTPPNGSFDMKYYAEVTGTYVPGTWEDKYTNLKVHFWLVGEDHGYMSMCRSEDGKYKAGCQGNDVLYYNADPNTISWVRCFTWNSNKANYSQDLGTYSMKDIVIKAGTAPVFNIAKSEICGKTETIVLTFSKEIPDLSSCTRPTITLSCGPDTSSVYSGYVNIGGSWGENINKQGNNVTQTIQSWSVSPGGKTGSGSTITGLQPNTRYTITATKNNGCATASSTCSFTTLAGTTASNCRSERPDQIKVDYVVLGGYGYYTATHTFQYRKYGTTTWRTFTTSTAKSTTTITYTGLDPETTYEFRAYTTTSAGTYYGSTIRCMTSKATVANITSAESYFKDYDAKADICYSWEASCAPVRIELFYRVKNGFDPTWLAAPVYTSQNAKGSHCVTIDDLIPNATVYECYVRATGCDGMPVDSGRAEFTTPIIEPSNYNCESLEYMLELICQALEAIKIGNKTIYGNQETKEHCDPYSENPTLTTLWSRFYRWSGAAACMLCDMVEFLMKSGRPGQYFAGQIGWVAFVKEIQDNYDGDDEGKILATSNAIKEFIDKKMHEVWHFHGSVDYIVDDISNVPSDATSVINLKDSKVYEKSGSSWKVSTTIDQPDDFAVYHINKENKTKALGTVEAGSAWYMFDEKWNNLDAALERMEEKVKELEQNAVDNVVSNADDKKRKIKVVDENYDIPEYDGENDYLYFVTEDATKQDKPMYRVHKNHLFGDGNIVLSTTDEIVEGALAGYTSMHLYGYNEACWSLEQAGSPCLNNKLPVTSNFNTYNVPTVKSNFGITFNGERAGLVDIDYKQYAFKNTMYDVFGDSSDIPGYGLETDEFKFIGWADRGFVYTDDTEYIGSDSTMRDHEMSHDMYLTAVIDPVTFTVTIDFGGAKPNESFTIPKGGSIYPSETPDVPGTVFVGWYDEDGEEFDFSKPIESDVKVTAKFDKNSFNVNFVVQDGDGVVLPLTIPDQQVGYGGFATKPNFDPDGYIVDSYSINGVEYDFNDRVYDDMTITVIVAEAVTVSFIPAGGEPAPAPQKVRKGGYATEPTPPTKPGCKFLGWEIDAGPITAEEYADRTVKEKEYNDKQITADTYNTNAKAVL